MTGRRPVLLATLALAACGPRRAPEPAPKPQPDLLAITGATLWDGTGRDTIANSVVLVRGERIVCAGTAAECPARGARVVATNGGYLIPGLIDSHVHLLFLDKGEPAAGFDAELGDLVAQGITTVRDMGTNPAVLLNRVSVARVAPRVLAMQLVAGFRFFYGLEYVRTSNGGVGYRQPPASVMQSLGWTPIRFLSGDDPDQVVETAIAAGATGLKLYADLDRAQISALAAAAHRRGLSVWGHAWVQPASALEQVQSGQDGVVHAAGLVGELFGKMARDSLRTGTALLAATARNATIEAAGDSSILAALDSFASRGVFFEPTLDATRHSVARFDAEHARTPSLPEQYARAARSFGIVVAREAAERGVRLVAGTDHVAYGPIRDRATLIGELTLFVDSVGLTTTQALTAATRDAAQALGGNAARELGTIEPGRVADLVLLRENPLADVRHLESVEWVMQNGKLLRPETIRSGIALR